MKRAERFIIKEIQKERFLLTVHARERMNERWITDADIIEVTRRLKSMKKQGGNNTYLLKGLDTWNEELTISVAMRNEVIIVTVFYQE